MLEKYYNVKTKTLTFPCDFDEELKDLPAHTQIIIFGYYFNQSVDKLPKNLTQLTFGFCFDKNVDNLPSNMTHLTFGYCFNQSVDNLPQSLTHLTFVGCNSIQLVTNLPLTMKEIKICSYHIHLLKNIPFGCTIIDEHNKEIFL